jgi:Ca-activated chloride channel family protein
MSRRRGVIRWVVAAPVVVLAAAGFYQKSVPTTSNGEEAENYTIRTTSRLVLLDVSVKSRDGGFVSGLAQENFKVYENGKPQQITEFANADIPVTVGILVDESGSMRPKRTEVIAAALEFIKASNPQDEVFVINFNERARRGLPDTLLFSDNIDRLRSALWQGVPEGRTALYDAIEMALHQTDMGRRDKKTLLVISDGGDNISAHKLPDVMHDVLESIATIYTIGIFDEDDPERNPGVLRQLAQVSGGGAYFPKTLDEVIPICRQIAKDVRTRYTVGYIPDLSNGKPERQIKVEVSSAGGQKLSVRTRTRYLFTPDSLGAGLK